jgi:hypothetical protein
MKRGYNEGQEEVSGKRVVDRFDRMR